jgi:hypothetical protein
MAMDDPLSKIHFAGEKFLPDPKEVPPILPVKRNARPYTSVTKEE